MTKGQVSTPPQVVDLMVEKLFRNRKPKPDDSVLDPGCGSGAFIEGIIRWCERNGVEPPHILGIESDSELIEDARNSVGSYENVTLLEKNFLTSELGFFDFIIGNPPYVSIEDLSKTERESYKDIFYRSAVNRFDLYILFFEKALKHLKPSGRLVFITPEKFEYTLTAKPLREFLTAHHIEEIHHLEEGTFEGLITYPTVTTVVGEREEKTKIRRRDGEKIVVELPSDGSRWISIIQNAVELKESKTLDNICTRISCGVATGRDKIFVKKLDEIPDFLEKYIYPTVSGRELSENGVDSKHMMIIPYDDEGNLLPEDELKPLIDWLSPNKDELASRHCVAEGGKKWYSFHENPPMKDILRPKILCKDVTDEPRFWIDEEGNIVPRHSVYYIIPKDSELLLDLFGYLNSEKAKRWLTAHSQRAANDFIRLQSNVLKALPVPPEVIK